MAAPEPSIPTPPSEAVHVERFLEPITGWGMVGVGAIWDAPPFPAPLEVEVRYDGIPRVQTPVEQTSISAEQSRYRFGVQLPRERDVIRVTVQLGGRGESVTLFDGAVADLVERGLSQPAQEITLPRWLSPAATLARSVASGEALSPGWWSARVRRYREKLIQTRIRVRDKLLIRSRYQTRSPHDAYVARTTLSPADLQALTERVDRYRYRPTISILVPVYNVDPKWLGECVESVRRQTYPHWELCLADDASTEPATRAYLDRLPKDDRIKLIRRPTNGHICAATNSAAELATGEFMALLDNDDLLAPHALSSIVEYLQFHPDRDLIYSDEDKVDASGQRYDPQYKPDWSPELLLSYNFINHFTVIRRAVFERAGRFREGYEGSQDHDLLLRVTELTDRVGHVPQILYHWRSLPSSTASTAGVKRYVHTSGQKAVADALTRRKIPASLYLPDFAEKLGLPILGLDGPDDGPPVAVIVRGTPEEAASTVRAIRQTTSYKNHTTYLVIDTAPPADALNRLAAGRNEEFLLFLEAGIRPTDPRWLSRLMAYAKLPGVGAAGSLIRGDDRRIISAGTMLGLADGLAPGDAFGGQKPDPVSYYFYAEVGRTVSATGRGCLLTRRDVFDRVGGFDADRFGQTLYDVDYCLRLAGLGLRSVHVGGSELNWSNPNTARNDAPTEQRALRTTSGDTPDPYYNPNLSTWDSFTPRSEAPDLIPASPAEPVRVLFATHNLTAFEGAPKIIQDVAIGLNRRGTVQATVFAPAPGKAADTYEAAGIRVIAERTPFAGRFVDGQWSPTEYETAQERLGQIIREARPQVVLANTLGLFPLIEAATRNNVPGILAIQESYPADLFARMFSPFGRWRCERAFQFADRVILASRSCAALYDRLDGRKNFEVIHNGLSATPFDEFCRKVSKNDAIARLPGPGGDRLRIVTVGTVCERKAQHILVEAAAKLAEKRRDFVCYLVGAREGLPYLSYVRNLIRARGLEDVVIPVAETSDVWTFLRATDVFACCSYIEAFSLSVMEAEAFGLPIVSTPCGGLDEQVAWDRSALRFDFGDATALANNLWAILQDSRLRNEMGRQSRAAFDLRLSAQGMLDRYQRSILAAAGIKIADGSPRASASRARVA